MQGSGVAKLDQGRIKSGMGVAQFDLGVCPGCTKCDKLDRGVVKLHISL